MSKELTPVDSLKRSLTQMRGQFEMALPKHIDVDRFVRVLQTAISTNPALVSADRNSLMAAVMRASQDGLLPDSRESALVTFKTKDGPEKVQYMPMIAGILKKIRNSGELQTITSQLVYTNDKFRYYVDGTGEHIEHEPNLFSDRGPLIGVYALATTKDGGLYVEVLTMADVEKVKNASRSKSFGPWAGDFASEMIRKTAIRRLSKRLPMSSDLDQTLSDDDKEEFVHDTPKSQPQQSSQQTEPADEPIDVSPEPQPKKSKLETIVEASEVPI